MLLKGCFFELRDEPVAALLAIPDIFSEEKLYGMETNCGTRGRDQILVDSIIWSEWIGKADHMLRKFVGPLSKLSYDVIDW